MSDSYMIHHIKKVDVKDAEDKNLHGDEYQIQDIILHKQDGRKIEITVFIED